MEHLALTLLGENQHHLINELTKIISSCECDILECKTSLIGSEFCANLLITGQWNAIAKLENQIPGFDTKYNIHSVSHRTKPIIYPKNFIPYLIYIVAQNKMGTLHELTNFFAEQGVIVDSLYCDTFAARQTGCSMLSLNMSISIPDALVISELRDRFAVFCDRLNLDGVIEPDKG